MSGQGFMYPAGVPSGLGGQWTDDYFVYGVSIATLAGGGTATTNFAVQADSDFEWMMTTCQGIENGSTEPFTDAAIVPVTVQITDSGSGRNLFLNPVPLTMIAGNGKQPYILPQPRIFQARATVSVVFASFSANIYNNINIAFHGRKIFSLG